MPVEFDFPTFDAKTPHGPMRGAIAGFALNNYKATVINIPLKSRPFHSHETADGASQYCEMTR
jgi:hypothetical protein